MRLADFFHRLVPESGVTGAQNIGIIGASGTGKSTLTQLMLRLRTPSSGKVLTDGRDVVKLWTEKSPAVFKRASEVLEGLLGEVAHRLVDDGVRRVVVAGGETSGAVLGALGIRALETGAEIAPGVPWMRSLDGPPGGSLRYS